MEKRKEDQFDDLAQKFFREIMKRGIENFPPRNSGNRGNGFDDMFNKFSEIVEKAKRGESIFDVKTEDAEVETVDDVAADNLLKKENDLLKEQVSILQQQLKDKEEIIRLLKSQQKPPRKKKA